MNRDMNKIGILLTALFVFLTFGTSAHAAQPIKLKFGHEHLAFGIANSASVKFAQTVKKETGGAVEITVHPAGSIGKERYMMEQVQQGAIDFALVGAQMMEIFVPSTKVVVLPGLFKGLDHLDKVLEQDSPFFKKYEQLVAPKNMLVLAFGGHQIFNFVMSKKSIYTLDDLKGMKIRVPEAPVMIEGVRSLGAVPVTVPWGEVYTALQLGTVDGGAISPPNTYFMKFYEVAQKMSLYPLFPMSHILLASPDKWKKLSPKNQQIIRAAAKQWGKDFSNGCDGQMGFVWLAKYGILELIDKGMTINAVKESKLFDEKVLTVTDKFRKEDPTIDEFAKIVEQTKY